MVRVCLNCKKKYKTRPSVNKKYCSFKCYRYYAVGKNANKPWLGKTRSIEDRDKFSKSHIGIRYVNRKSPVFISQNESFFKKGHTPWNKGKKGCYTPEQLKKILVFRRPNKQEDYLMNLLENLYPKEWKYVGNGEVIIEGKNPDYININGKKKIIELFGNRWHEKKEEKERIDIFAKYGYKTLIIWSSELSSKKKLLNKLNNFYRTPEIHVEDL